MAKQKTTLREMKGLRDFIEDHYIRAKVENGKLLAFDEYSQNGQWVSGWVELKPNLEAVRDWLGY